MACKECGCPGHGDVIPLLPTAANPFVTFRATINDAGAISAIFPVANVNAANAAAQNRLFYVEC